MPSDHAAVAWIHELLKLPAGCGPRFPEEWHIVARRVEAVHDTPVSHDTEPAGAPRLDTSGG